MTWDERRYQLQVLLCQHLRIVPPGPAITDGDNRTDTPCRRNFGSRLMEPNTGTPSIAVPARFGSASRNPIGSCSLDAQNVEDDSPVPTSANNNDPHNVSHELPSELLSDLKPR